MPRARAADGTRIAYEVAGGGLGAPAVLLIMGLGVRGELWADTRDALAADGFRTVTMDNRGIGESAVTSFAQTTTVMAQDAVAVLRAAFVERAHVVGVSLGGMVAQQLAVRHPRRVEALVLQSTSAGLRRLDFVPGSGLAQLRTVARARRLGRDSPEYVRAVLTLLTTQAFAERADLSDPRLRFVVDAILSHETTVGYVAQARAAWRHRGWKDVRRIVAPTLVQHGAEDRVVSPRAAAAVAERIPGARLRVYSGAGHLLALQRPDSIDDLRAFLACAGRRAAPRGARR
jgi:pimeloyl-ACP methyl ester carboxylesterase